MKEFWKSFQIW